MPATNMASGSLPRLLMRGLAFLGVWLIVHGAEPADLPIGLASALLAAGASLRLLPPGSGRMRPIACAQLALRFTVQSTLGGLDVARRVFDPRLPLRTGFLSYPLRIGSATARSAFGMLASLVPGTLPAGLDGGGAMLVHCLDVGQPVAAQLAIDEALLARVVGVRHEHG